MRRRSVAFLLFHFVARTQKVRGVVRMALLESLRRRKWPQMEATRTGLFRDTRSDARPLSVGHADHDARHLFAAMFTRDECPLTC
jgi:hypothetical protein